MHPRIIVFDLQVHDGVDAGESVGESAEQSAIAQAGVSGCLERAQKLLNFAVPRCPSPSRRCFVSVTPLPVVHPPPKQPQAKIQTVKKQIPVKKITPDRIEELVKKHLGNIGEAANAFKSVSALLEKHKTEVSRT